MEYLNKYGQWKKYGKNAKANFIITGQKDPKKKRNTVSSGASGSGSSRISSHEMEAIFNHVKLNRNRSSTKANYYSI